MGRDTYSGGGTTLIIGENGTIWDSRDPAANPTGQDRVKGRKTQKKRKIGEAPPEPARKDVRSFISQCVVCYMDNRLTETEPVAPKPLRAVIRSSGGNIKWLSKHRESRSLFYELYCQKIGEESSVRQRVVYITNCKAQMKSIFGSALSALIALESPYERPHTQPGEHLLSLINVLESPYERPHTQPAPSLHPHAALSARSR